MRCTAPLFCVVARSFAVPRGFCLLSFPVYEWDGPLPDCLGCRTIRTQLRVGVYSIHSGFGTSTFSALNPLAHMRLLLSSIVWFMRLVHTLGSIFLPFPVSSRIGLGL